MLHARDHSRRVVAEKRVVIMDVTSGRDQNDSSAEMLARLARLMEEERVNSQRIAQMSEESVREFLNDFLQRAANILGLAVAKVSALMSDLLQIGQNTVDAFSDSFRRNYASSRRIKPFKSQS